MCGFGVQEMPKVEVISKVRPESDHERSTVLVL